MKFRVWVLYIYIWSMNPSVYPVFNDDLQLRLLLLSFRMRRTNGKLNVCVTASLMRVQ